MAALSPQARLCADMKGKTMIYAVRKRNALHTLVEFPNEKAMADENVACAGLFTTYDRVRASYAHQWVRNGREHETGLYLDEGRVRYAKAGE